MNKENEKRCHFIQRNILTLMEQEKIDDSDLIDLYQFFTQYLCALLYTRSAVTVFHQTNWPRPKVVHFLKLMGFDQDFVEEIEEDRGLFQWTGIDFCAHFVEYLSTEKKSDKLEIVLFFHEFFESIQPELDTEVKDFIEPIIADNQWEHNYNPSCGCGLCEWARENRCSGNALWLGTEFESTCDEELRSLIQSEGESVFNYIDEEDIYNPNIRKLYRENKISEICEELEVC